VISPGFVRKAARPSPASRRSKIYPRNHAARPAALTMPERVRGRHPQAQRLDRKADINARRLF